MTTELKIDWKNQTLLLKESLDQAKPHLVFTVQTSGITFKGKNIMFLLPDDRTATIIVDPVDAKGFSAPVEDLVFSSSDEAVVTIDTVGLITPTGIGTANINVTADSLIGEGVVTIAGILEVQVVAGQAVSLAVTAVLT
jgi:hypothetical protein